MLREYRNLFENEFKMPRNDKGEGLVKINYFKRAVIIQGVPMVEVKVNDDMAHKIYWRTDREKKVNILKNHPNFSIDAADRAVAATLRAESE